MGGIGTVGVLIGFNQYTLLIKKNQVVNNNFEVVLQLLSRGFCGPWWHSTEYEILGRKPFTILVYPE
jgi:hypothetical protein